MFLRILILLTLFTGVINAQCPTPAPAEVENLIEDWGGKFGALPFVLEGEKLTKNDYDSIEANGCVEYRENLVNPNTNWLTVSGAMEPTPTFQILGASFYIIQALDPDDFYLGLRPLGFSNLTTAEASCYEEIIKNLNYDGPQVNAPMMLVSLDTICKIADTAMEVDISSGADRFASGRSARRGPNGMLQGSSIVSYYTDKITANFTSSGPNASCCIGEVNFTFNVPSPNYPSGPVDINMDVFPCGTGTTSQAPLTGHTVLNPTAIDAQTPVNGSAQVMSVDFNSITETPVTGNLTGFRGTPYKSFSNKVAISIPCGACYIVRVRLNLSAVSKYTLYFLISCDTVTCI